VFFKSVNDSQSYHKFGTALSPRIGRATATFLHFYVSHSSATRFLRNGKKYYINFMENSLMLPTVKDFLKSVNSL